VRKRPMIRSRPTTARPQQRYDHGLRHLVQRTGDVTVAANLGVPRSTAVLAKDSTSCRRDRPPLATRGCKIFTVPAAILDRFLPDTAIVQMTGKSLRSVCVPAGLPRCGQKPDTCLRNARYLTQSDRLIPLWGRFSSDTISLRLDCC
jgi:hypothetical protein